jgi:predicted Zn-dependent peptidase
VERDVPVDAIYQAYHMCDRKSKDYYATDLISDILSNGKSSRLVQRLVKEQKIFSKINAYITGDIDPGLFIVTGDISKGVSFEEAQDAVRVELNKMMQEKVDVEELNKVKNKVEANLVYSEINVLNRAMSLAYFELLGDANMINKEVDEYQKVTPEQIQDVAKELFREDNCSELMYHSKK